MHNNASQIHKYRHTYTPYMHSLIHTHTLTHTHTHIHKHTLTRTHIHTQKHTSTHTFSHTHTHTNAHHLTHSHIYTHNEMNYIHILTSCKIYLEIPTQSQNHKITTSPNHPPSQSRATHLSPSIHIRPPLHQQSSHFRVTIGCCLVQGGPLILCGEMRTAGEEGEA